MSSLILIIKLNITVCGFSVFLFFFSLVWAQIIMIHPPIVTIFSEESNSWAKEWKVKDEGGLIKAY